MARIQNLNDYTVKIAQVFIPDGQDVTEPIRLQLVAYDKGVEMFRENVVYDDPVEDVALESFARNWANKYVSRRESQKEVNKSTVIGKAISFVAPPQV